jgi:5-methylcytosine-specific restriction endonuclease McrA
LAQRKRYWSDPEKYRAEERARFADPEYAEKRRAYRRAWYVRNREKVIKQVAEYNRSLPEDRKRKRYDQIAAYRKANAVNYRAYAQNRRTREGERLSPAVAAEVLAGAKVCCYCGKARKLTIDHRLPIARGGTHARDNLVAACGPCNSRKGKRTDVEFRGQAL